MSSPSCDRHQIARVRAEAKRRKVEVTIVFDFVHVLEYIWDAAWCFFAEDADDCADYLIAKRTMLRYHRYLRQGMPIATGAIEGACRHLIVDRMDITGARWSVAGAEAILRLRSLRSSGDFDDYWRFHLQTEHPRNHASRYKGRPAPRLIAGGASS